ncbi:DUF1129 family protein [Oceanobacillus piezotolerans]|uniref:DUF1129 family protein n=1 Tax=Oceanobacillus piezotolerans TaxID=2448030 RepID=A0A498DAV7_9BACI|nr:DUF1129 family protein [Oceanobacillus piezotolerans]RLL42118.1 DUF1129 family protein [Oceanobacillus piezotolerans]
MNAIDIMKLNNEKRKQLNSENEQYYEDMIVYIRTNAMKSEQQTEEVLLELLEHLLAAQEQGRTAKDIFGEDLKAYCEEVIQEIPGEKASKNVLFLFYLLIDLAAVLMIFLGILSYALYHFFGIGTRSLTFPIGTGISVVLIDGVLLAIWIYLIFRWMKGSTFKTKKPNKFIEFLQIWLMSMIFIGLTMLVFLFMPEFGTVLSIPLSIIIGLGIILFIVKTILNKRYRITK